MHNVAILGIGQTAVAEHWGRSLRDLAASAGLAALQDAGLETVDALFVGNMTSGRLNRQQHLGALIADSMGLAGIEATRIEAACGSAGATLRQGMLAVSSGQMEAVLVIGVEKLAETLKKETTAALAGAADAETEGSQGVSFVALNALIMRRYMVEHGYEHDDFAPFALNAHANGANNPHALFQKAITTETYHNARMVADPIGLYDASPIGDGAAAAVLVPAHKAPNAVRITGSALATDTLAVHDRWDVTWLDAAEKSAQTAYRQAGVAPDDIDLFELHDAFSIMAALSLEAAGFAERGQGVRLAQAGEILPHGRVPIASMGGLKARGHPVGATGLYQIVEAVQQLRGEAGAAQIDGVQTAMTQNIGGSGATIATHILQRTPA